MPVASLPPGGRWILRSKRRKEQAEREIYSNLTSTRSPSVTQPRDSSLPEGAFFISLTAGFFVSFLLFLLSQKKKQEKPDGKRKKKKGSAVSLGVLEKRLFRIKCSDRFSSLRRDCGMRTPSANPTVPDLLVSTDGGRWSFVHHSP